MNETEKLMKEYANLVSWSNKQHNFITSNKIIYNLLVGTGDEKAAMKETIEYVKDRINTATATRNETLAKIDEIQKALGDFTQYADEAIAEAA